MAVKHINRIQRGIPHHLARSKFCVTNHREPSCWLGEFWKYDKPRVINSLRTGQIWATHLKKTGTFFGSSWSMSYYCWIYYVSAPLGYSTSLNPQYAVQACVELLGSRDSPPPHDVAGPAEMHHWAWLFLLYTTDWKSISIRSGAQEEMPMVGRLCSLWWEHICVLLCAAFCCNIKFIHFSESQSSDPRPERMKIFILALSYK